MENNIFVPASEIQKQIETAKKVKGIIGEGKKVYISTFGCQQNEADSERLMGLAYLMGYAKTEIMEEASLIIFNTCAIREHAELKALSKAGALRKLKEKDKSIITALCGCMAEQAHRREQIFKSYPYIDIVFGTDRVHTLPEMIYARLASGKTHAAYVSGLRHDEFGVIAEGIPFVRESTYKAWVSIMYGCNNFCTYCVVPYVRGRERSRKSEDILKEIEGLVKAGYKDITLLGQNVNSYKGDLSFPELLAKAASFDGEYWLRFMTSHPKDASKELVDVMAANPRIAPQFHLPMQSGNDRVLSLMNRRYTVEQYMEKAAYIRQMIPDAAITSDIICGYPTETEAEFEDTVKAVDKVGFDALFTFVYSPRPGTPAAEMEQVPHDVKTARFARLCEVENGRAEELNQRFLGRTLRVLSDGKAEGKFVGRTGHNKIISFTLPEGVDEAQAAAGKFIDIKVTDAKAYTLEGIAMKSEE